MARSSGPTSGANTESDATDNTAPDQTDGTAPTAVEPTPQAETKPKGSPYDLIRVRDERSGNEHTVTRVIADGNEHLKVIHGKTATDANGRPIPPRAKPTHRTNKAGQPAQEA